jgi:hypothetical protein
MAKKKPAAKKPTPKVTVTFEQGDKRDRLDSNLKTLAKRIEKARAAGDTVLFQDLMGVERSLMGARDALDRISAAIFPHDDPNADMDTEEMVDDITGELEEWAIVATEDDCDDDDDCDEDEDED